MKHYSCEKTDEFVTPTNVSIYIKTHLAGLLLCLCLHFALNKPIKLYMTAVRGRHPVEFFPLRNLEITMDLAFSESLKV